MVWIIATRPGYVFFVANRGRPILLLARKLLVWIALLFRRFEKWTLVLALCQAFTVGGLTLDELRHDASLTPESFASRFKDFQYEFHSEVQPPDIFLATRRGDCDDYATLADAVLREKGYHTKLIAVRMPGLIHVVCYVSERGAFLDFNNRDFLFRMVHCKPDLEHIARTVARSFAANWTSASEFIFANGLKRMVITISQTDKYTASRPAAPAITEQTKIKVDF